MRTVQEIFDLAMTHHYYSQGDRFMCCSLDSMYDDGLITKAELSMAINEIVYYMRQLIPWCTGSTTLYSILASSLKYRNCADRFTRYSVCRKIYSNWAARPYTLEEFKNVH